MCFLSTKTCKPILTQNRKLDPENERNIHSFNHNKVIINKPRGQGPQVTNDPVSRNICTLLLTWQVQISGKLKYMDSTLSTWLDTISSGPEN